MFRPLRLVHRLQLQLQCRQASGSGAGGKKTPFPGDDILVPDEPITRAVSFFPSISYSDKNFFGVNFALVHYKKISVKIIFQTFNSHLQVNDPELDKVPEFSSSLLTHLERLSLVRFSDEQAVASLRESIRIANRLKLVHVEVEILRTFFLLKTLDIRLIIGRLGNIF